MAADKSLLDRITVPTLYVLGGPDDMAYPNGMDDFSRLPVPGVVINTNVGHKGTYAEENGGRAAQAVVAWLNWQLRNDQQAARWFVGPTAIYRPIQIGPLNGAISAHSDQAGQFLIGAGQLSSTTRSCGGSIEKMAWQSSGVEAASERRARVSRCPLQRPVKTLESPDFLSDVFGQGRRFPIVAVNDDFTRECLAFVPDTSIFGRTAAASAGTTSRPASRSRRLHRELQRPIA